MLTVLITGHLGFIGKHLKPYLENKNYNVIGFDLKEGQDILTSELPDCDYVIHLAAVSGVRQSIADPAIYWRVNVDGTRRILDHYKNKRVLVASSSSQYEPHLNPYAASKHVMESIPHVNVCFMRFHTVYSSTPRENMFFYKLLNNTLEYVTDHERDFIHIDDICDAIDLLLDNSYVGALDIGTGNTIKINNIAPYLPLKLDTPNERKKTKADTFKMLSIGFKPKINVNDFIANYISKY
jgi:nucleoside-diphosphate-sugar epimerase